MTVFSGDLYNTLKRTLNTIVDDKMNGESDTIYREWMDVEGMDDQWVDDLTAGGPGLASAMDEGEEIPLGDFGEGYLQRYLATKFGLKLNVTDEAIEDSKYPQIIKASKRLVRAMWKTVDVDATFILIRGFDTNYVGGDGQPLWSASHTTRTGQTFSNLMGTPASPSVQALITARAQLEQMIGHDGVIEGYEMKKIIAPPDQRGAWEVILNSTYHPDPGQFNAVNVANRYMQLDLCINKYWTTTTTNWAAKTDAEDGIKFMWRRRPKSNQWVEQDHESMKYSITARWARGWTDPRGSYGVNA